MKTKNVTHYDDAEDARPRWVSAAYGVVGALAVLAYFWIALEFAAAL